MTYYLATSIKTTEDPTEWPQTSSKYICGANTLGLAVRHKVTPLHNVLHAVAVEFTASDLVLIYFTTIFQLRKLKLHGVENADCKSRILKGGCVPL